MTRWSLCRADIALLHGLAFSTCKHTYLSDMFISNPARYYYLNAKLKVFSNHHPAFWKLLALYAPLLGAFLITGALTIDEFHNWYDCLAGAVIGSVMATSAYRMVYASIFDFRVNHIPLTRHTPFAYGAGAKGAGGFESAVFTRAGGWGYEEAYGGAPFDMAYNLRSFAPGGSGLGGAGGMGGSHHGMGGSRHGDVEHNAGVSGYDHGHHGVGTGHHDGVTAPGATMGDTRDGRYHHHSRSMERKAIPTGRRSGEHHRI